MAEPGEARRQDGPRGAASDSFSGSEPLCAQGGRILPEREARIPIRDRVVQHGEGLFETIRVVRGRPFQLERHLERLRRGASEVGIDGPVRPRDVEPIVKELLAAYGPHDAVMKLILTAGDPPALAPSLIATIGPVRPLPPGARERGIAVQVAAARTNPTSRIARLKATSYLERALARRDARAAGCYEALFLDPDGYVAEGAASNVFWVRRGRLHTPALLFDGVAGTMRALVLEIAAESRIPVEEGRFPEADLLGADEVFLTNALIAILPVGQIDGRSIPAPGPLTCALSARVEARVAADCP